MIENQQRTHKKVCRAKERGSKKRWKAGEMRYYAFCWSDSVN